MKISRVSASRPFANVVASIFPKRGERLSVYVLRENNLVGTMMVSTGVEDHHFNYPAGTRIVTLLLRTAPGM
jgi:hypothetical protein